MPRSNAQNQTVNIQRQYKFIYAHRSHNEALLSLLVHTYAYTQSYNRSGNHNHTPSESHTKNTHTQPAPEKKDDFLCGGPRCCSLFFCWQQTLTQLYTLVHRKTTVPISFCCFGYFWHRCFLSLSLFHSHSVTLILSISLKSLL